VPESRPKRRVRTRRRRSDSAPRAWWRAWRRTRPGLRSGGGVVGEEVAQGGALLADRGVEGGDHLGGVPEPDDPGGGEAQFGGQLLVGLVTARYRGGPGRHITRRGSPGRIQAGAVEYEIRVGAVLDGGWSAWFEGLEMTSDEQGQTVIAVGGGLGPAELGGRLSQRSVPDPAAFEPANYIKTPASHPLPGRVPR
jgi:hypothetical protein